MRAAESVCGLASIDRFVGVPGAGDPPAGECGAMPGMCIGIEMPCKNCAGGGGDIAVDAGGADAGALVALDVH